MANNPAGGQGGAYYPAPNYPPPQPYGGMQAQPNPYPVQQPYGGMQPQPVYPGQAMYPPPVVYQVQSDDQPRTLQEKLPAYIFICLAVLIIVLSAIALELHEWVHSCGARISLTDVYDEGYDESISYTKDMFCDGYFYLGTCKNVCSVLKHLNQAGKTMRGVGITSTLSTALCILRMVLLLVRPRRCCKGLFMRIGMVVAMIFWVIGTVVYVGYYASVKEDASDSSIRGGLGLAIAVAVLQIINCVIGNIAVSKLVR